MCEETYEEKYPCREKHWGEIDSDEKIERMRTEVRHLREELDHLRKAYKNMESHQHLSDGEIVVPFKKTRRHLLREVIRDDQYF